MKVDTYLSGFFLVGGSTIVAMVGVLIGRRLIHARNLINSHEVGGYLLSVVGTMYAVILGLIVVESMANFEQARLTTEQESNALADLILLSNRLPDQKRQQIQKLALAYIDRVVDDEWPMLDHGTYAPSARRAALDLIDAVCNFEPQTASEQAIYDKELDAVCQFWNSRRTRTVTAAHGVPALEWVVLIVGGVITLAFIAFFRLDHLRIQLLMTAMVTIVIALNMYMVLMFGYPYSGQLKVPPDNFKVAQAIIEHQTSRSSTPPAAP
jgi:hypothetical protein